MANNIRKKIEQLEKFAQLVNCVRFLRFAFFFYSFISFVFWFLDCLEVDWRYLFAPLFQIPYQIVSTFYSPQGVSADFSLAIIGALSLILGLIIDSIFNKTYEKIMYQIEVEQKNLRIQRQKSTRKKAIKNNAPLPLDLNEKNVYQSVTSARSPFEDARLIFIIMPHINRMKRAATDPDLTFEEVEVWKQRINKRLLEKLSYSSPMQKGYYRKKLFLIYKDFNFVNDFIEYVMPTIDSVVLEFQRYGIRVVFSQVLSALTQTTELEKELDCMDTVLSLNFYREIVVTGRFKLTYENKLINKFELRMKGEYNLSKNLTVSNRQALYTLIDNRGDNYVNENNSNGA